MRHEVGKTGVFAHGVVGAEVGAEHGALDLRHAPCKTYARLEGLVPGKHERPRQTVFAGGLFGLNGESGAGIGGDIGQAAVFFGVGREELPAHAVVERKRRENAPVVHGIGVKDVVAEVAFSQRRVERSGLRQTEQEVGDQEPVPARPGRLQFPQ